MTTFSTAEAARLLGLKTSGAVRQLILSKRLAAQKVGCDWRITQAAINAYQKKRRKRGRPRKGQAQMSEQTSDASEQIIAPIEIELPGEEIFIPYGTRGPVMLRGAIVPHLTGVIDSADDKITLFIGEEAMWVAVSRESAPVLVKALAHMGAVAIGKPMFTPE